MITDHRRIRTAWLVSALVLVPVARGQNPDLMLTQAERDSILATYDNIFPIWGRKAIERGFALPTPAGIGLNATWINQDINITNLSLSTNDNPLQEAGFIQMEPAQVPVAAISVRPDLWVLPFLNVYVIAGLVDVSTTVRVVEPVAFETNVEQSGGFLGLGLTGTIGIRKNFVVVDLNWAWTQTEKLDFPVRGRLLSFRYGRAFKPRKYERVAVWLGAMQQHLVSETRGSISLGEVFPPEGAAALGRELSFYRSSAEYQNLPPGQRAVVDQFLEAAQSGDLSDVTVNYGLEKEVADPWNMLAGASVDLDKNWGFRVEAGFIGRVSALLLTNFRFDL
jgi:hypothetical protein